ncbi:MAG: hypothetical protein QNJ94_17740 [Alphaproteobacteria bacterium]|nr:hypothetical protein [Alphaproteobacteria bacterium]
MLGLILCVVGGALLSYPRDGVETHNPQVRLPGSYEMRGDGASVNFPWWVYELPAGVTLHVSLRSEPPSASGEWFLDLLARETGATKSGRIWVDGSSTAVSQTPFAAWQRIPLAKPPAAGLTSFAIRYEPATPGARLALWGVSMPRNPATQPYLERDGARIPFAGIRPVSFRGTRHFYTDVRPSDEAFWPAIDASSDKAFLARLGVRHHFIGRRAFGVSMVILGLGGLLVIASARFLRYASAEPLAAAAIAAVLLATAGLRLDILNDVTRSFEFEAYGSTISNGLFEDSLGYFLLAFEIFNNDAPVRFPSVLGYSLLNAGLFEFFGVDPRPGLIANVLFQTAIGGFLYFAVFRLTGWKWFALLPAMLWMIMAAPGKHVAVFLTDSMAMFLLGGALCLIMVRPATARSEPAPPEHGVDAPWPTVMMAALVFAAGAYVRDVLIVLAPVLALGVWLYGGRTVGQKVACVALFTSVTIAVWLPTPLFFEDKGRTFHLFELLPIGETHFRRAQIEAGAIMDSSSAGFVGSRLGALVADLFREPLSTGYGLVRDGVWFWVAWWNVELMQVVNRHPFLPGSYFSIVWDPVYAGVGLGTVPLLIWAIFWWRRIPTRLRTSIALLSVLLVYVTLFHILLFPHVVGRPKAIYLPLVVLNFTLLLAAALAQRRASNACAPP